MASEASERVACVSMATHVVVAHVAPIVVVFEVRRSTTDALQFWQGIMSTHIWNFNLICGSFRFALLCFDSPPA